ncbi:MAG: hypothetical protein H6817_05465 [Phycisphaerales bacterium]|nr:hypothetical protein [Phycisphaerales bacterium]
MASETFTALSVRRKTTETDFAIEVAPRAAGAALLALPNKLLAHFVDHFTRGAGWQVSVSQTDWPRSWEFDHVLCEDFGQLLGKAAAAIAEERAAAVGIKGRATAESAMDDAASTVSVAFESRPRCTWAVPRRADLDGFVDSWYAGDTVGVCYGTNIKQFLDGFAYGGGVTLAVDVRNSGNLHHVYETIFRNLGDAIGIALGTAVRLPGDGSGLAGTPVYEVKRRS